MTDGADCSNYRSDLSAYLDGELTEAESALARAHLDECRECAADLADLALLESTVAVVAQEAPRERVPDGLADAICGRLASARGTGESTQTSRRRGWSVIRWVAQVAALLLAAVGGYTLHDQPPEQSQFGAPREANEQLVRKIRAGERTIAKLEAELVAVRQSAVAERAVLEQKVVETSAALARQAAEIDRFRMTLEDARTELAALRDQVARQVPPVARSEDEEKKVDAVEVDASPVAVAGAPSRLSETVVLRRVDGHVVIEVSGRPEEVVRGLLPLARDENDPVAAAVALGTLEHVLAAELAPISGESSPQRAPQPRSAFLSRLTDGIGGLARPFNFMSRDEAFPGPSIGPRESRLRRVEQALAQVERYR